MKRSRLMSQAVLLLELAGRGPEMSARRASESVMKKVVRFARRGLLLLSLALACADAQAQIKFIHLTDLHLYDGRRGDVGDDEVDSLKVLAECIQKINELRAGGIDYKFVAVTGDLGIEEIVRGILAKKKPMTVDSLDDATKSEIEETIRQKATALAEVLAASDVTTWLFVPGNNDLVDESPDTIEYYHLFVKSLRESPNKRGKQMAIIDLCPEDGSSGVARDSTSAVYTVGDYAFVGYDNASFKNINSRDGLQAKHVGDVKALVEKSGPYVYIFYHIPEVDDPYLVYGRANPGLAKLLDARFKRAADVGEGNLYSAWFVPSGVRESWEEIVKEEKVRGLFAGHLHDWRQDTYKHLRWMRSFAYPYESLTKLYIAPPLSAKLQGETIAQSVSCPACQQEAQPSPTPLTQASPAPQAPAPDLRARRVQSQARGFQEVSIDRAGRVLNEQGRSGVRVFWYDQKGEEGRRFGDGVRHDDEEKEGVNRAANLLLLGQFFEGVGRTADAASAYAEAAKDQALRALASESLERVREKEERMKPSSWLLWIGAACFGIVVGWIVHRTLRRSQPSGLTDIATVVGAVGGATVLALFRRETGEFSAYCIGLLVGFFGYLLISIWITPPEQRKAVGDWLGTEPSVTGRVARRDGGGGGGGGSGSGGSGAIGSRGVVPPP